MKTWIVQERDEDRRLDRFMSQKEHWPRSLLMKALRTNKLKVNGKRESADRRLCIGDVIASYVETDRKEPMRKLTVVYEDEQILCADKPAGLLCLDDSENESETLWSQVRDYLGDKGKEAYPIHRIDFNTSGLVLFAKNRDSRIFLDGKMRKREIHKKYVCVVFGSLTPPTGTLTHQLFKDAKKNRVFISKEYTKGSKTAILQYKTVAVKEGKSLVCCELITGRTHQIRSQMAYVGHPVIGDDKYGRKEMNRRMGEKRQLLRSQSMTFAFSDEEGICAYLKGKTITGAKADFAERYFAKSGN